MHVLGLWIKVNSYVSHVFYTCSSNHNTAVSITIKKNKYFIFLNTHITVFAWLSGNSNKN